MCKTNTLKKQTRRKASFGHRWLLYSCRYILLQGKKFWFIIHH